MTFNGKKVSIISQPPLLSIEKKGTLVGVTNRYKKKEKEVKLGELEQSDHNNNTKIES